MKKLTLLMLLLLALFVVACGTAEEVVDEAEEVVAEEMVDEEMADEETADEEMADEETADEEMADEETADEEVAGEETMDNERVTLLYWQAPSTLNSYLSGGTKEQEAASPVLEPLARYDENGEMVPYLAVDIPTVDNGGVSEDLTQITWQLKEGIMWSDGSPLTADDVIFTYEYCSTAETGCVHSQFYEGITSVTAGEDNTVTITFDAPRPFPYGPFVSQSGAILQKAQFGDCVGIAAQECTDQNFAPIGTGPYTISEFLPNDTTIYTANPMYREEGKPFFQEVFMKGGGDAAAAARSVLETGEADYAWNLQVEPEILTAMTAAGNGQIVTAFGTSVERILINQTNPDPDLGDDRSEWMDGENPHPFLSDINVVNALSLAIDREILVATGYGAAGQPTCNLIPAPPAFVSTANDACLTQDVDAANALLDEGGYIDTDEDGIRETPDGIPLKLLYQTSTNSVRQGTQAFIKQMWAEIGVDTELRNIDASVFFGGDVASPDTYGKFYSDIEMYTNSASGLDIETYISGTGTSDDIAGAVNNWQGGNVTRFYSEEFDALAETLSGTADLTTRADLIKEMNDLMIQGGAFIPLIHRGDVSAHSNSLQGVRMNTWDTELWNIADWTR